MKKCTICQKVLEINTFQKDKRMKDGTRNQCKFCSKIYNQKYKEKNRLKLQQSQKKYDTSPSRIYTKLKSQELAKKKLGRKFTEKHQVLITKEDFLEWYNSQEKKCFYCGIQEKEMLLTNDSYNKKIKRMTIDRMDSEKPYVIGNLALACLRCNHIKGNFFTAQEMVEIGKLFISKKWKNGNKI